MAALPALRELTRDLHLSFSQIRTYIGCSLQYFFKYVAALPPERQGVSLPFGGAVHAALERYYRTYQETGKGAALADLQELFTDNLKTRLDALDCPVVWKKDTPDLDAAVIQGNALLQTFHEQAHRCLDGMEVVEVELPLAAPLWDEDRVDTGLQLVGVVDLLLRDREGRLLAVDHKTSSKAYAQEDVDQDLQLSAYAYLLTANRYGFPSAPVRCRFDVLRKLKTPKLELHETVRTSADRRRFAKVAAIVARGIELRLFAPTRSWLCADCPYGSEACARW